MVSLSTSGVKIVCHLDTVTGRPADEYSETSSFFEDFFLGKRKPGHCEIREGNSTV